MAYHVFISYRRDGGDSTARLLYDRLKADGYEPFYDVEQMRSGRFNEQLYARIEECEDFLLILPPNGLDRCGDPGDWVRLEIAKAIELKKNIVPFMLRNFEFPQELPDDIDEIRNYQGVPASPEYFESTFERLKSLLDYKPAYSSAHPQSPKKESGKGSTSKILVTALVVCAALVLVLTGWIVFGGKNSAQPVSDPVQAAVEPTAAPQPAAEQSYYVGNRNRKRFHEPDCPSVETIKPKYRMVFMTREEAVENNFIPCGECHP